jgi:parallel beta-helix repeat protein
MRKVVKSGSRFFALALILGGLLNLIALADAQATTIYKDTTRTGNTTTDERWQGTIDVIGDITVATGSTLTIDPGTIVRFAAGSDDQHKGSTTPISDPNFPHDPAIASSTICSINIYGGALYAIGTPDKPIVFTSSAINPQPGDWESILYILPTSILRLQYTIIEYGYYGVQINTNSMYNVTNTNITINNNIMRDIVACGVCCGNSQVSITVSNNDISSCGHEGVDTHVWANLVIENNVFHDIYNHIDGPTGAGVVIDSNSSIVRNNTFERSRFGINVLNGFSTPSIYGNVFVDNYADLWGAYPAGAPKAVTARAGNKSAVVSFEPQPSRFPMDGYIVSSSSGNITKTGISSPIIVTGLNNGTAYRFTVSAVFWSRTGPASDFSNSVTPGGRGAPLMLLLDQY